MFFLVCYYFYYNVIERRSLTFITWQVITAQDSLNQSLIANLDSGRKQNLKEGTHTGITGSCKHQLKLRTFLS